MLKLAWIVMGVLWMLGCSGGSGGSGVDGGTLADADGLLDAGPSVDAAPIVCDDDRVNCDNVCIDPETSRDYCGATTCEDDDTDGVECEPGTICDGDACVAFACESVGGGPACNPVTQAGCGVGEKCAQLVESADPFLARTACVPDGVAALGDSCTTCGDGMVGYDNCAAGAECLNGVCTEICSVGPPDTCRVAGQDFDEGSHCTLFADLFTDDIGLCVPSCSPTNDTVSAGVVSNNDCNAGEGCYLNSTRGTASCSTTPTPAQSVTQNQDCYGPGSGGCFLNGCASGFTALLNNAPVDADGSVCARYCTPQNTYSTAQAGAEGAAGKCSSAALMAVGGTNGASGAHQCRFIQTFYGNTGQVSPEVGMCVPVTSPGGDSWADCTIFDWDGIQNVWNTAVSNNEDEVEAFNQHCLIDPDDPQNSDIKDICQGLFRGCISQQEEDSGLLAP